MSDRFHQRPDADSTGGIDHGVEVGQDGLVIGIQVNKVERSNDVDMVARLETVGNRREFANGHGDRDHTGRDLC